jgi:choline dehydrogenase
MAVMDRRGRVHGFEGLRALDAAVRPDVIRADTNATAITTAERVADWSIEGK